jgi:hypothetical protein
MVALSCAGCGPAPKAKPVAEVVPQIRALNGQIISVSGYLGECAGYECRLFVDEAGRQEFQRAVDRMMRTKELTPWPPHLGIGSGKDHAFDRKAKPFTNSYVVITGTITDRCRDERSEPGCTDRSTDLEPTDIAPLKDR